MGNKNQFTMQLNWQSASPVPFVPNTPLSGNLTGTMSSTNTIYSNILDVTIKDNQGLEVTWTGTPTGVIQVMGSDSGQSFYPLTFNPALAQPAGSGSGYLINLNQFPFKYLMVQYTNTSGSGVLSVWITSKDLN
jgi:hypothetical protein